MFGATLKQNEPYSMFKNVAIVVAGEIHELTNLRKKQKQKAGNTGTCLRNYRIFFRSNIEQFKKTVKNVK